MTARIEYELRCDGPPGAKPFDCPTPPIFGLTIALARVAAAKQGWVCRIRRGGLVDLCPEHKAAPQPAAVRGECAVCGKECRLTMAGLMWAHKRAAAGSKWMRRCPGSGKPPKTPAVAGQEAG